MRNQDEAEPRRAMVIIAHPDDAEFTCAGTVARWIVEGWQIIYVVCTDGSKGTSGAELSDQELVAIRESEQRRAAEFLGVKEVVFLRYPDGELARSPEIEQELAFWIRRLRPAVLLTFDPWRPYQLHPDHRTVGLAALNAVLAAGNRRFYPEQLSDGLSPHLTPEILLFNTDNPNHWVDISATMELKLKALQCHESQVIHIEGLEERLRAWNRSVAEGQGFTYAEAFKRLNPGCDLCQ